MTYTITDYLIDLYRDDSTVEPNFSSDTDEQAYAIHLHNCYCQKEQNYRFVDVSEQNQMTLRYDDIADYVIKANAIITLNDVHWVYDKGLGLYRPNDNDIESTILKILEECGYSQKNPIKHASQETMHRISSKTTLKECPFDHDQRTILVKNGVLDLETRALLPFSPAYGFTRNLNVTYDPDANSTPIRAYLNSLVATERDVALLLQMVAQAITQAQIKKSYICYNKSGNNGKSTYLNLVRDFLGPSKVSSLSLQDICKGGFRTANIEGKWANIYPDLPKETIWDDSTFKAITGNDTIPVERKYEQAHDYANNAPFMFGTNEFPTINTSSNAFYNRFYLIEFPNQFPVDPKFNEKLFTEINKSALLNLVLEAVWNLKQNGPIPQSEDAIREQWLEESDNAYRFIKKYMVIDNEAEPLPFLDLHHLYSQDCIARKEKSKGQNKFKDVLTGYFGFQVKSKGPQGNQILYVLNAQVLFDELCLVLENPSDIPYSIYPVPQEDVTQDIMD